MLTSGGIELALDHECIITVGRSKVKVCAAIDAPHASIESVLGLALQELRRKPEMLGVRAGYLDNDPADSPGGRWIIVQHARDGVR